MFSFMNTLYKKFEGKQIIIVILGLFILNFSGCATKTSTKDEPITVIGSPINLPESINPSYPLIFTGFRIDRTDITLKHYEDILKLERSHTELNQLQKESVKSLAIQLAKFGFVKELFRSGFKLSENETKDNCSYILTGSIANITINTYGDGSKGLASAGDYWETYITYKNLTLRDSCSDFRFSIPEIVSYAKLKNSPTKTHGNLLDALNFYVKQAINSLTENQTNSNASEPSNSTIELASRLAAQRFIEELGKKQP